MKVKVVTLDDFGGGYCVVTRDDGSTVGQIFKDLPIDNDAEFTAQLDKLAGDVIARTTVPTPKVKDPSVIARIGEERDVAKK